MKPSLRCMKTTKYGGLKKLMENLLILTALFSFVAYCLITWASTQLERRQARVRILRMRKCSRNSHFNQMYRKGSWIYDKNLKSKILIWTRLYLNWIEILDLGRVLTCMVLLAAVLALVVNLICNSCLATIPL